MTDADVLRDPASEIARLQRGLRDLVALLAIPATWRLRDPTEIVVTSLDVLIAALRLQVGAVRVHDRVGAPALVVREPAGHEGDVPSGQVADAIAAWLAAEPDGQRTRLSVAGESKRLTLARVRLGLHDDLGTLVAGATRDDFPDEFERLLLRVGANQVTLGLQATRPWRRRARERALRVRFDAMLDERARLAREMHDTLLQGFTGVSLELAALAARVREPETAAQLTDLLGRAQRTLIDARRAIWGLRDPVVSGADLGAILRQTGETALAGTDVDLDCEVTGVARELPPDAIVVATRVAQEALANVARHARARHARVRLAYGRRSLRVTVLDDGVGFVVDPDFRAYSGHWGLLGMHEHASRARGTLAVRSAPGAGTEIALRLPYLVRAAAPIE